MWTGIGLLFILSFFLLPYWLFLFRFFAGKGEDHPSMGESFDSEGKCLTAIFIVSALAFILLGLVALIKNSPLIIVAIIGFLLQPLQYAIADGSADYPSLKKEFMELIIKFNKNQKEK